MAVTQITVQALDIHILLPYDSPWLLVLIIFICIIDRVIIDIEIIPHLLSVDLI